jgi:hypothetical protein
MPIDLAALNTEKPHVRITHRINHTLYEDLHGVVDHVDMTAPPLVYVRLDSGKTFGFQPRVVEIDTEYTGTRLNMKPDGDLDPQAAEAAVDAWRAGTISRGEFRAALLRAVHMEPSGPGTITLGSHC